MNQTTKVPTSVWVGRVLSGLFILFMLGASIAPKLFFSRKRVWLTQPWISWDGRASICSSSLA